MADVRVGHLPACQGELPEDAGQLAQRGRGAARPVDERLAARDELLDVELAAGARSRVAAMVVELGDVPDPVQRQEASDAAAEASVHEPLSGPYPLLSAAFSIRD